MCAVVSDPGAERSYFCELYDTFEDRSSHRDASASELTFDTVKRAKMGAVTFVQLIHVPFAPAIASDIFSSKHISICKAIVEKYQHTMLFHQIIKSVFKGFLPTFFDPLEVLDEIARSG